MSEWQHHRFSDFLIRSKVPITISDNRSYKRITIKTRHGGIFLRDIAAGDKIGTKKQFIVKEGQFVLSKIDARYGAFGITSSEVDAAIITGNFWAYDVNQNIISIEWLNNFTNSEHFYDICERASRGTTHRKYLDEEIFLNNELVIPDVATQIKILEQLNCKQILHQEIANCLTHQQTLLKKLRQQILQEAIEGKLSADWRQQNPKTEPASELLKRIQAEKAQLIKNKKIKPQKTLPPIRPEEKPFALPDGWEWLNIDQFLEYKKRGMITGPFGSALQKSEHQLKGIPVFGIETIKNGLFTYKNNIFVTAEKANELKSFRAEPGDIIISRSGTINEICVIPTNIDVGLISTNLLRVSLVDELVDPTYFCYMFKGCVFVIEKLKELCSGSTRLFLNQKILKALIFPVPPLAEQKAIVAKVEKLLALCDQLESKINQSQHHANSLMQAVLQEAFAGASI